MLSAQALAWGRSDNIIREMTAYGARRKAEIGPDKVFDFSIGNPSVPAPEALRRALLELLEENGPQLHAYTPAPGLPSFRRAIAEDLRRRYGAKVPPEAVYVTCGASSGLSICTHALLSPGDKALTFTPYFPEYRLFVEAAGAELVEVPPAEGLQPDLDALERLLDERCWMLIFNSPNNPSGVLLPEEGLRALCDILRRAEARFGHPIWLLADEPYRELVYDGRVAPCVLNFYDNSILCYSYSKSLSLPGERLGYLALGEEMPDRSEVFAAICGAGRSLGYINAPSLFQRAAERCIEETSDVDEYRVNRDLLYGGLTALGYDCVYPDGAFYLFFRSPEPDAVAFCQHAQAYELVLVPSNDFGLEGYVRAAYCVSTDMIRRAMPAFAALAGDYGLRK